MKTHLGWLWLAALVVVPATAITSLVLWHNSLASAAVPALKWSEMKVVEDREVRPLTRGIEVLSRMPDLPTAEQPFAMDFTHADARGLDLGGEASALNRYAIFDSRTQWPSNLPPEFQPDRLLELGKDPGLGVRALHRQGITGTGVRVAFLDAPPLWRFHPEYRDKIVKYVEVGGVPQWGEMSIVSVLAGETTGVAPGARVSYYAVQFQANGERTFLYMAAAINRVLDENLLLPAAGRVRVICAPIGANPKEDGYEALMQAYRRAQREGVFIVTSDMDALYQVQVHGLGRAPYADPNDPKSYQPGSWWEENWLRGGGKLNLAGTRLVFAPMEARTIAAQTGAHFRYYPQLGLGSALPWGAGLYALAAQVKPNITPEEFLKVAFDTGDYITVNREGKDYRLGPIINPTRIIRHFQTSKP